MKPIPLYPFLWLAALPILLSGAVGASQPLTVTNPGFEQPAVAENVFTNAPVGWSAYNGVVLGTDAYAYNPTPDDFSTEAPVGLNVGALYWATGAAERGIQQTLSATFQEGGSYLLSVKVGYSAFFPVVPGYRVQLLAGGTVIAEDDNSLSQGMSFGQFVTSTVEYAYDPQDSELVGQPLQIRLINKGLVNNENEVAFDDVQLFAVLANPFAAAGGPYYLPNPDAILSLNAGASLPSGNATITAYAWDLDNDGDFDENITGATPAGITFLDLQNVYGMVDGSNTVRLRVTDSSNKTATALATVELVTSTKYTGPNTGSSDTWNSVANWDNGLPGGDLDVVILAGKTATAWSNATPYYTGNLTIQNNARLTIGWTAQLLGSYNALGTPGFSKIIMNPGSSVLTRMGGTPVFPEIKLLADGLIILGTSTQGGAQAQFNHPITGSYQLHLQGNNQGSCVANLNALNSFSALLASGTEGGVTIRANAFGSLGTGDVTIAQRTGNTTCYAILEVNAANAMADTGTLSISGTGATRLRMNANDMIAKLILDGVEQPVGTYGSTTSSATYKHSWISGTGILTVAVPPVAYWDLNGATAGAGGTAPSGTWNASNTFWNTSTAGTGSVAAWTPGHTAVFSAGSDATGAYAVDVLGSQDMGGLIIRSGSLTLSPGSGGALRLTSNCNLSVEAGSSIIATPINQDASARGLTKYGVGSLTLSGNLSHTGGTTLVSGNLVLSGNNSAATGSTTITSGVLRVDAPSSIPGTAENLTIGSSGTLVFGPSFDSSGIQSALNNRVVPSSAGTIAADNNPSDNFDFNTAGLAAAYFGALGNVNYTGTLTPQGNAYRLSGDGGTLTMANTNALSGNRTLTARGYVQLAAGNNYTGATTVETNSSLSLLGSSSTSGITLNSGTILTVGNNSSLGSGALVISGAATLKAIGDVVTTNAVSANADFVIAGTGALTLGATTIDNNRIILNSGVGTATFGSITRDGANNRNLTIGGGNTTVTGNLILGTGTLTKNNSGTLTLQGANTYAATTVSGGILRLEGSVSGTGTTTIDAARLQLVSASNGGLPSGSITLNNVSAVIEAVNADRAITNSIIMSNNGTFAGSSSLTVNGVLTNSGGNRTLTNSIASDKALNLGGVDLSNDATSRTLTIAGSGSTVISGAIANGGGFSTGSLIKSGPGTLILNGASTYAGTTTVNANGGKLFVNGSTGAGNVTINSGATLGGTGTIGGNTTIAANALLEFEISTATPANHDKLELSSSRTFTFSGVSQLTVTGATSTGSYTLLTAPGGIIGTLPSLVVPDGWAAGLSKVGNDLVLNITFIENTTPAPTLVSIQDNQGGGPINTYTPVTYTVTFNQDMNVTTFSAADFGNAGTSAVTFGAISEPTPGVFTILVTPITGGTLRLRINQGASLRSALGVNLNTSSALLDDVTLQANTPVLGSLDVSSGDFLSSGFPGGPFSPSSKQYTLINYGSQTLNWTAGNSAAWLTLSSNGGTLAAGASTTVTATLNGTANSLVTSTYNDAITFTNTTNGQGNATRQVSLAVNGLPVQVNLGNLNQTYDGTPKSVTVTTDPTPIAYSVTYNGLSQVPTTAGTYDVAATVTESGYSGSASGTLLINKAVQTISFAALDPVGNDLTSITLTANASSGLPVSFSSSNSDVATVSGSTATITGTGVTTITASQQGDENYLAAANVLRELNVIRVNPIADPGGPYVVDAPNGSLFLDGSGSLPSGNDATITLYEWDLNINDNGGIFNASVSGVTPAPISAATLLGTWGMASSTNNTIRLRITDSAAKTSTVSTTVYITAPLLWDANAAAANRTDGGGGWLSANQWWTGTANTSWISGSNASFGNGGAGGAVALPAPASVGSITFNTFTGTYSLGSGGQNLTISGGINKTATSGAATFASPLLLGADQTWSNPANTLTASAALDLSNRMLTIDNSSQVTLSGVISGSGGIIKNGTGRLHFNTGNANTYSGPTIINNGILMIANNVNSIGSGNLTLNGGVLEAYWGLSLTRTLGPNAGQIQIVGGASGFSENGRGQTFTMVFETANYEVVWGSDYFKPSTLVLQSPNSQDTANASISNKIDLNGATRTVEVAGGTTGAATGTLVGIIRNSSVTPAGLIKTGVGRLNLNAANTYNGGTTLQAGTLQLGNLSGLGSSVAPLTVNAGLLNLNNIMAVTVGNLTGTGGTIANNGAGAVTFTIGSGGGTGGNFQGGIANNTNAGAGTLGLTKTGTGSITLSGANTYTGATNINQGKLFINGSTGNSMITVASGASLGGTGTIGGNTTVAAGGKLEFNLSSPAVSHDPLNIAGGKTLAFSGASELTITLTSGVASGTYVLVTGGNNITGIAPATLNLPLGCSASASIVGNELLLQVTQIGDVTPPTLAGTNFVDDKSGGPVAENTLVTYTVTFSEDMDASTVTADDFGNAGTSTLAIGTVTEPSPGVFTVPVTPVTTGTLQLRINASAVIKDVTGNSLNTTSAIADNTTITVLSGDMTPPTLAGSSIIDDKSGGPVALNTLVTYTVTFSEDMNASTVTAGVFGNQGTSAVTIGAVTETSPGVFSVQATPTTSGTLRIQINGDAEITDVAGNVLDVSASIADDTTITVDGTAPTLAAANIVDDKSGGPVAVNTLVTYTLTFSEEMNAATVSAADFGNAGTAATTIGAVTETSPGVFTVAATPTTAGTLIFRVKQNAVLSDVAGNNLNTTSAIADDTTITVDGTAPTLAAANIVDDKSGGPVAVNTLVTYTVTFSEDMNAATVTTDDFDTAGTSAVTLGTITETTPGVFTVQATPTTAGTLIFRVKQNAVLSDVAGNSLNTASAITDNTTITVNGTTGSYETWSAGAPFAGDANGDGVANALAWVLGAADPNAAAYSLIPTFDGKSDPNFVVFTYRRTDEANNDPNTIISVQYSTSLTSNGWGTATHDGTNVIVTESNNFHSTVPGIDRVEVRLRKSVFSAGGKLFVRLNVAPAP